MDPTQSGYSNLQLQMPSNNPSNNEGGLTSSTPSPASSSKPSTRRGVANPDSQSSNKAPPSSEGQAPSYARAYRSRKTRPCDLCRRRKSRCVIEVKDAPCASCAMSNKECTFVGPTTKRKRTSTGGQSGSNAAASNSHSNSHPASRGKSTSTDAALNPTADDTSRRASYTGTTNRFEPYPSTAVLPDQSRSRRLSSAPGPPSWSRSSISASTSQFSHQFSDLVANLINGDSANELFSDDASEVSSNERAPIEERGLAPFVLGSSSDMREDPLLKHASSGSTSTDESGSRIGGQNGSSNHTSQGSTAGASRPVQAFEVRQVTRDVNKPVFFAFIPSNPYGKSNSKGKELGAESYQSLRKLLRGKITTLMALYAQRDASAFPILSNSQRQAFRSAATGKTSPVVSNSSASNPSKPDSSEETEIPLPTVLSISTLATATVYDHSLRAISRQAWGYNLHALKVQFEVTSLVTIQIALTDLTGRPSINSSGNALTLSQTYALAHMLGLHLDCTTWHFPKEERDLRTRLFWGLFIHDKFSALCWGRPSIIHEADYTVPLPSRTPLSPCQEHLDDAKLATFDFGGDTSSYLQSLQSHLTSAGCSERAGSGCLSSVHQTHTPGDTFVGLCRLSLLLSDVLREFHSVRASSGPRRDSFSVVQSVKSYLVRLEDWKAVLPTSLKLSFESRNQEHEEDIPGTSSLQLSYYGVLLLLCRTALDAVTANETLDDSRIMPAHQTALHAALQVVDFVEGLTPSQYTGFWFHYGSHHLASCLSLLSRLVLGFTHLDEPQLAASAVQGFERLFKLLVDARKTWLWDLAELSLTRCKAILPALEDRIPDFPSLLPLLEAEVPVPPLTTQAAKSPSSLANQARSQSKNFMNYFPPANDRFRVYSSGDVPTHNPSSSSSSTSMSSSNPTSFHNYQHSIPNLQQHQQHQYPHYTHSTQYEPHHSQFQPHQRSHSMHESDQFQNRQAAFPQHQGFTVMGQSPSHNMFSSHSQASSGLPPGLSLDPASLAAVGLGDWGNGGLTNFGGQMTDPTLPQTWNPHNQVSGVEGWMPVDLQWLVNAKGNEGGA